MDSIYSLAFVPAIANNKVLDDRCVRAIVRQVIRGIAFPAAHASRSGSIRLIFSVCALHKGNEFQPCL